MMARALVPGQFDAMRDLLVDACTATRADLADRVGAKVVR